ncbi:Zinc finger, CCHC-type superfamily [Sesbania bispinosa]|nr:Zinc finger, CCHC-type superfamily [Sesbania bispinosa]
MRARGKQQLEVVLPQILPPTYKKGPDRPKKLRRREPDEEPNPSRLRRTHTKYTCGNCHQYGHNTRKCPSRPTETPNVGDGPSNEPNDTATGTASAHPPAQPTNPSAGNAPAQPNDTATGTATGNPPTQHPNASTSKGKGKVNDQGAKVPSGNSKRGRNTQAAQSTTAVSQQQAPGGKPKRGRPSKKSDVAVPVASPASGPGIVPNPHAPPTSGPGIVPILVAPPASDPANVPIHVAPTADQLTNPEGQLTVLQNAFDTTMFMMSHCNAPTLPPNLVEASNIIKELLTVAQQVTSGKPYDWKKVANTLGVTHIEPYMTFMESVDNATAMCAPRNTTGYEDGGTQQSVVTNIEHQKEHQGGVDYNPSN